MKHYLEYPDGYKPNPDCNGCGTGWNTNLVPDTIYGIDIREACCIHDFDWEVGGTRIDKVKYDLRFLRNMLAIIKHEAKWYHPEFLCRRRALKYYEAVSLADGAYNYHDGIEVPHAS